MAILKSCSVDSDASARGFVPEEIDLGDDVLAEIILRLPLESVARSRCVSKNWCAAIADGYLRCRLPPAHVHDLLPRRRRRAWRRRQARVRVRRRGPPARGARLSVLAFDPLGGQHYHVINFTGWRDRGAAVEVFSSETRAWAARDVEFGGVLAGSLSGSVHCHGGAVYFLASDPDCVVRMDLAAGAGLACTVIDLPEPADGDGRVAHSGGRLHYFCSDGGLLKVWSLEDDRARQWWRLKHAVRVSDVVDGGGGEVRFLAMHPENQAVVYIWSPWKVVEYDLGKREITGAAWEFGKGARNCVVKSWLVASSCYLSDCFADDGPVLAR
uniref:Uncharacterized protein n=1 Tax=Aegilops tauschii TaxID=37682 RepID=M8BAM1_AEGTA